MDTEANRQRTTGVFLPPTLRQEHGDPGYVVGTWRGTKPWCNVCGRSGRSTHRPTCSVRQAPFSEYLGLYSRARGGYGDERTRFRSCEGSHQGATATPTVTLPSVLSTIFHCACMFRELVRRCSRSQAPPACDPDKGDDTIGVGWERGGTPPARWERHNRTGLRLSDPCCAPIPCEESGTYVLDPHGRRAFLMRGSLPLVHRLKHL
jgi:hypothetical protein